MKKFFLLFILCVVSLRAVAQSGPVTGDVSFQVGTVLPSTCTPSPVLIFYLYSAGNYNKYECISNNVWLSSSFPGVTSDGANGITVSGSVAAGAAILTNAEYSLGTCTTAKTIDPANGTRQKVTLTNGQTCALTFTQPSSGTASVTLKITQSAVSSYNGAISGCKWPGGVVPTITATSGAVDFVSVYLDGTTAYCVASQNFQ